MGEGSPGWGASPAEGAGLGLLQALGAEAGGTFILAWPGPAQPAQVSDCSHSTESVTGAMGPLQPQASACPMSLQPGCMRFRGGGGYSMGGTGVGSTMSSSVSHAPPTRLSFAEGGRLS